MKSFSLFSLLFFWQIFSLAQDSKPNGSRTIFQVSPRGSQNTSTEELISHGIALGIIPEGSTILQSPLHSDFVLIPNAPERALQELNALGLKIGASFEVGGRLPNGAVLAFVTYAKPDTIDALRKQKSRKVREIGSGSNASVFLFPSEKSQSDERSQFIGLIRSLGVNLIGIGTFDENQSMLVSVRYHKEPSAGALSVADILRTAIESKKLPIDLQVLQNSIHGPLIFFPRSPKNLIQKLSRLGLEVVHSARINSGMVKPEEIAQFVLVPNKEIEILNLAGEISEILIAGQGPTSFAFKIPTGRSGFQHLNTIFGAARALNTAVIGSGEYSAPYKNRPNRMSCNSLASLFDELN